MIEKLPEKETDVDAMRVHGVPVDLTPSEGSSWRAEAGALRVRAAPHSDLFVDPGRGVQVSASSLLNAATLLGPAPAGDFQLSAHVRVAFAATFDAGVLLVWLDERHWAKLCFEYSPEREPMIVSVVNRDVSDDANGFTVHGDAVWLRVSRIGAVYAYHSSVDGVRWELVRAFSLEPTNAPVQVGFEAQSPTGDGCDVVFAQLSLTPTTLADLRDGS